MVDCDEKKGIKCTQPTDCYEGCQCKPGYYFLDGECVPPLECGCTDQKTGKVVPVSTTEPTGFHGSPMYACT